MWVYRGTIGMGWIAVLFVVAGCETAQSQSCTLPAGQTKHGPSAAAIVSTVGLRVPEKAWSHYAKAVDAARALHAEEMDREIVKALTIAPAFAEPYVLRAVEALGAGRFAAAAEDASAAVRVDPRAAWAGVILAGAYNGMRRYAEAAEALQRVPRSQSETWQAKYEMTRAFVGLGNATEALYWSAMLRAAAPESCTDTRILRADAFMLAHRWSEAVAQLTFYLASEKPQYHRAEALKVLERIKRLAQEQEGSTVASTGNPLP